MEKSLISLFIVAIVSVGVMVFMSTSEQPTGQYTSELMLKSGVKIPKILHPRPAPRPVAPPRVVARPGRTVVVEDQSPNIIYPGYPGSADSRIANLERTVTLQQEYLCSLARQIPNPSFEVQQLLATCS